MTRKETLSGTSVAFVASDEKPLFLTDAAVQAAKKAIEAEGSAGDGLRISIVGGGCSGYQYNLDFESETRAGDLSLSFDDLKIFIDPVSAGYLMGTVVDYVTGLSGAGFKFNNPNARRTCGCGHSST